jgi:hypothetical protein
VTTLGRARAASTGAAVLVALAVAWPSLGTTVDDAWISARYADQLVAGHGLIYSVGLPAVEGYTNLLWVLLLAAAQAAGVDLFTAMESMGLGFGLTAVALSSVAASRLHPEGGLVAPWLLAASVQWGVAVSNGLETGLWLAALLAVPLAADGARTPATRVAAGIGLGLLGAVRPEGFAVGGVLTAALLVRDRRDALPLAAAAGLTVAALFALRLSLYGAWLPNTFAAKSGSHEAHNLRYVLYDGYLWPMVALAAGLALPFVPRRSAAALVAALGAGLVLLVLQVNLWMPGARLLLPGGLAAAVLIDAATAQRLGRALAAACLVGMLGLWATSVPRFARRYDAHHSVAPHNPASLAAQHLARHLPRGSVVAVRDAGVFAYHLGTDIVVVETHQRALTLPHPGGADLDLFAYLPHDPVAWVRTVADPDAKQAKYGNDRRLRKAVGRGYRSMGRVEQHYRRYYDLFVRVDAGVPPLPAELRSDR